MTRSILALIVAAGLFAGCANSEKTMPTDAGLVRHVVMFKFNPTVTPAEITEVETEFAKLPAKIPGIVDYEWGTNNSPEGRDMGYTHCFIVTFDSEASRDAYLPHPAHMEFVEIAVPRLEDVHVLDYVVRK